MEGGGWTDAKNAYKNTSEPCALCRFSSSSFFSLRDGPRGDMVLRLESGPRTLGPTCQ